MTIEEFATWCRFFQEQLCKAGEDTTYVDDWYVDLKKYELAEAIEAVRFVRTKVDKYDTAKKLQWAILEYLRGNAARLRHLRMLREHSKAPPGNKHQEEYLNSEFRKKLLARMDKPPEEA